MTAAAAALVALICWLCALQALRVGRDRNARPSRVVRVTTAVLGGAAAVLVVLVVRDHGGRPLEQGVDPTPVALLAVMGWFVAQQGLRVGRDGNAPSSPAALVTTAVLVGGAVLLAVPHLYLLVT
jgi:hypothetical protein